MRFVLLVTDGDDLRVDVPSSTFILTEEEIWYKKNSVNLRGGNVPLHIDKNRAFSSLFPLVLTLDIKNHFSYGVLCAWAFLVPIIKSDIFA